MGYWAGTYEEVYNRLNDWWEKSTGGNVADPYLDMINRANNWLWQRAEWDYLTKTYNITAVLSGLSATLPADFGRFRTNGVYSDTNGDGLPEYWYYLRSRDVSKRYTIADNFTKAAGHSRSITFGQAPLATCYADYVAVLEAFTGEGTEYSFFPSGLLFRASQKLILDERGVSSVDVQTITNSLTEELRDFIKAHQAANVDKNTLVRDSRGQLIQIESYMSDGGDSDKSTIKTPYNNSYVWP